MGAKGGAGGRGRPGLYTGRIDQGPPGLTGPRKKRAWGQEMGSQLFVLFLLYS